MLLHRITKELHNNTAIQSGDTIIVGTSAGVDSTSLLHLLVKCNLRLSVIAVYVDHCLRPAETDAEFAFIQNMAAKLNIEAYRVKADVPSYCKANKCSIEAGARTLRYNALEEFRNRYKASGIAVAHTADDQVEEFFIRICRGTGLKGLTGMETQNGYIIRPLLHERKETLIKYLEKNGLSHCIDSSNEDRTFLRNRVRLDLLPQLEQFFNPSIRQTILQTIDILGEDENFLEEQTELFINNYCEIKAGVSPAEKINSIRIDLKQLLTIHSAIQRRVLEKTCWKMGSKPSYRKIVQLQKSINQRTGHATFHFQEGLRVQIEQEFITFLYPAGKQRIKGDKSTYQFPETEIPAVGTYPFPEIGKKLTIKYCQPEKAQPNPDYILLDGDKIHFPLMLRSPKPGEKIHPLGAPGSKKIARILSDIKIPASQRPHYPLLTKHDEVLAIVGLKLANRYKITENTKRILRICWETST